MSTLVQNFLHEREITVAVIIHKKIKKSLKQRLLCRFERTAYRTHRHTERKRVVSYCTYYAARDPAFLCYRTSKKIYSHWRWQPPPPPIKKFKLCSLLQQNLYNSFLPYLQPATLSNTIEPWNSNFAQN